MQSIKTLLSAWRWLFTDVIELAALETRLAGQALVWMIGLGVAAALLAVTAWLLLVGMLIYWLAYHGLGWQGAMLAMAAVQMLLAAVLIVMVRRAGRHLTFSGTRGVFYESEDEPVEAGSSGSEPKGGER